MKILERLFRKKQAKGHRYWELLRLGLGFIFFWSFLDKTFGLGFATSPAKSWLAGASPTAGFLAFGTEGSYMASVFQSMAGSPIVDWLFMMGLLGVGLSLLLGIGTRVAGVAGALMMALIYLAVFPLENNPVIDEHIIYIIILIAFTEVEVGVQYGLREKWKKTDLVKKYPWLE